MRVRTSRLGAAVGAAGLLAAGLVGLSGPAQADPEALAAALSIVPTCETVTQGAPIVVPDDFVPALSDTRSAGHWELSGTALHVSTDDATSQAKVAEYWAVSATPLGQAGEPSLDWAGSAVPPGLQLVVDLDGNGTTDGILVGETVYGNRWWANGPLRTSVGTPVPPALASPGGDGSAVAGTLSDWLGAYPSAQVLAVGFSLGSGVLGDGLIASITFACVERSFAAPTPVEFSQTELFGSTAAGGAVSASYLVASGPTGQSVSDGLIVIGVDFVTAAELASCTAAVDGGAAAAVQIEYNPVRGSTTYSGALLHIAAGLVIEPGFSLGIDVVCQTTAGAVIGDYDVTAWFTYGNREIEASSVAVEPGGFGALADVLSITAAPAVASTPPTPPTATAAAPSTSAVLAATGPADASGALRLGVIALLGGIALTGASAVRRTGSARQN